MGQRDKSNYGSPFEWHESDRYMNDKPGKTLTYQPCVHEPTEVFYTPGNLHVFAAKEKDLPFDLSEYDLVLNASGFGRTEFTPKHTFPNKAIESLWEETRAKLPVERVWKLDLPDQRAPWDLSIAFWKRFLDQYAGGKVLVYCIGGHGRTGTLLTAMCIATGMSKKDSLNLVRKAHCDKAVESREQHLYLAWLESEMLKSK